MADVGVALLMVHFLLEMALSKVQSKVQRPPMPSKATEDLADFESRLAPKERGRSPKLLPTLFMSRGGRFRDIFELLYQVPKGTSSAEPTERRVDSLAQFSPTVYPLHCNLC